MRILLLFLFFTSVSHASPWKRHTIIPAEKSLARVGADGVRLADVNDDGLFDVITGWEEGGAITIALNPGPENAASLWDTVTVGKVRGVEDALSVDLNGDGRLDVVSCAEGKLNRVFVHWAPSDPARYMEESAWKTESFPSTDGRRWMFAEPLDVNRDGRIDIILGSKNDGAVVAWLQHPVDSERTADWELHILTQASWIMSLRAIDLDEDGRKDLVYSDRFGESPGIYWLHAPAQVGSPWVRRLIGGSGKQVMFLSFGNLNGGETTQIICATLGGELLFCDSPDSREWAEQSIPLPFGLTHGKGSAIADVNLDGRVDIVTTAEAQREADDMVGIAWKESTKDGWIDHAISDRRGRKFDRIEMIDLDQDGDLDLVTCEEVHNLGVVWYENPTN